MNAIDLILAVLVAVVFGTLGYLTYSHGGWLLQLAIAFFGALAGAIASRSLHAPKIFDVAVQETQFPIIYSVIGSVLFVAAIGFFFKPKRY
jgi:uncharacterized membrane protein YeaQ/YmgE (transglycosylase-associated protein family)